METPTVPGIKFHHCFTFSLGGNQGTITNVINNYGGICNTSHTFVKITDYTGGQ